MESSIVTISSGNLSGSNNLEDESRNSVGCSPISLCFSKHSSAIVSKRLKQRNISINHNALVMKDFVFSKATLENLYKLLNTRGKTKQNSLNGVCVLHTIEAISQLGTYGEVLSKGVLFDFDVPNISEFFYINQQNLEYSTDKVRSYGKELKLTEHYYIQLKRKYLLHFQSLLPNFNLTCFASTPLLDGIEGVVNVMLDSELGSVFILDILGNISGHVFLGIKLNNGLSIIDTNLQGVDSFEKYLELLTASSDSTAITNYIKSLRPTVTRDFKCFFAFSVSHLTSTEKKIVFNRAESFDSKLNDLTISIGGSCFFIDGLALLKV